MRTLVIVLWGVCLSFQVGAVVIQGANGSGGGMGVVCKNSDGSIKSVELLDLWEARTIYSRNTLSSSASVEEQVEHHLQNLKNSIYADSYCVGTNPGVNCQNGVKGPEALYYMLKFKIGLFLHPNLPQVHRLRGAKLQNTNDSFEVVTPSGNCEIDQLVIFKDTPSGGDVLINQDLVDHMDKTNEAALYIHEAYYYFLRGRPVGSSLRVRRAVGLSFSGHKFRTLESYLSQQYYECRTQGNAPSSKVFIYTPESGFCADRNIVGPKTVAFQIATVAGISKIDFEEPSHCSETSLEEVFNRPYSWQDWGSFGSRTGFDYSVFLSIGGLNGLKQATIELLSAPDQPPSPKTTLNCELKTKQ